MTEGKYAVSYAVTFILTTPFGEGSERIIRHFDSIAEVRDWAEWVNYVLGIPQKYVNTYAIEHADGSQLSQDELKSLQPEDSRVLYMKRQRDAMPAFFPFTTRGLYGGAAHSAIATTLSGDMRKGSKG